jgi:hypothetical protein
MTQQAFERREWQEVINAHPLESHNPAEWLRYGIALLQTIEIGPGEGKQQQQAALAFVQAQREGASLEDVQAAQRQSVLLSLGEALSIVEIAAPDQAPAEPARADESTTDPLRALTAALAEGFGLKISSRSSVLDQLLAAKQQLRSKQVSVGSMEELLRRQASRSTPDWDAALEKVLMVLRLP